MLWVATPTRVAHTRLLYHPPLAPPVPPPAPRPLHRLRFRLWRFRDRLRRFLPAAQLLIANAQFDVGRGVPRCQRQQRFVTLDGLFELIQFELKVSLGGVDFRTIFAIF